MRFNIVFVGSVGGGKTSIIKKYTGKNTKITSTIAVDFIPIQLGDIKMSMWDTCGQERFMSITSSYFMRGHVFILVHDILDSTVAKDLEKWRNEIVNKKPPRHQPVVIVVTNKVDLHSVCTQEVSEWINKWSYEHVYTSAKTGEGIDLLFKKIQEATIVHQSDWLSPSLPALPVMPETAKSPGCAC
jgi:small GTP-binding protein